MSSNIRVRRICVVCNQEFLAKTTVTKYCSSKCRKRAYRENKRQGEKGTIQHKQQPTDEIKTKEVLSILEVSLLIGVSKRTVFRLIEQGKLKKIKIGSRTLIKRADIDSLFEAYVPTEEAKPLDAFDVTKCYTIGQVQEKYNISEKSLYDIIKRNKIQKMQRGKYVYVQQKEIDKIFNDDTK